MSKSPIPVILVAVSLIVPAGAARPRRTDRETTAAVRRRARHDRGTGARPADGRCRWRWPTTSPSDPACSLRRWPSTACASNRILRPGPGGSLSRALDTNPAPLAPSARVSAFVGDSQQPLLGGLLRASWPTGATYRAGLFHQNQQVQHRRRQLLHVSRRRGDPALLRASDRRRAWRRCVWRGRRVKPRAGVTAAGQRHQ